MKRLSPIKVLLSSAGLALLFAAADPSPAQAGETVHGLRQAGWVLVEKSEHDEWHMGVAPYENISRLVYVVKYTLRKEGKTMICTLERDVMLDTAKQTCAPAK
ncbi:MAG: hypothetical protein V3R66_04570 [Rhodospirillales bacterium]